MGCSHFQRGRSRGGSTVSKVDHTANSGVAAGEAKGGWRLEVKDD
jgi:hypothetical protein